MIGLIISVVIAVVGFILNIYVYKNVTSEVETLIFCAIITVIAVINLIYNIIRNKKAEWGREEDYAHIGIALSIITIVLTVIFLLCDFINLNTTHFVPVHS